MSKRYITELFKEMEELKLPVPLKGKGNRVHLLALGDVGANLLLGLKLMGAPVIDAIGIFDVNPNVALRYEMEMNQIGTPFSDDLPKVEIVEEDQLFDCDMFIFCASKAVPKIGVQGDVRMMQLKANSEIVSYYGKKAGEAGFRGIFAVVSDPVDPLCKAALMSSGLKPAQVKGYGLGVMNRRAMYYAKKDERFAVFLDEGRVFGPHGGDLVVANSIENYDDELSRELTELTTTCNLKVRELGFKPFIAPALSSGAFSLIATLAGQWNYSSLWLGRGEDGAFLGVKNRICGDEIEFENLGLPEELYKRIEIAYENLRGLEICARED
ncbi:MAG: lactate dehydrogenase [Clostridia bacterium]|nr:lactate dehydrogenase [Clostridia bacterium]